MSTLMPLAKAEAYALHLMTWLSPYCVTLHIAGSIRRQRPFCADVDIVCIPKVTEQKDMLGQVIARQNHCLEFLQRYIASPSPLRGERAGERGPLTLPKFISGGEKEGKQVIVQLPKCQLDLWFADAETFGTRLLCRTGSKEHNIWLATRAQEQGLHWNPYEGLTRDGEAVYAGTEYEIYGLLGLGFIPPQNRERDWLSQNIDSGL